VCNFNFLQSVVTSLSVKNMLWHNVVNFSEYFKFVGVSVCKRVADSRSTCKFGSNQAAVDHHVAV
jgi:hypothetical protein